MRIIGVPWSTYRSWERNLWGPRPWHLPSIIKFLGYDPYASASTGLGDQLKFYRRTHGLTQQQLANIFNIHIATLRRWERDTRPLTQKIKTLIETACSDRQIKEGGWIDGSSTKDFFYYRYESTKISQLLQTRQIYQKTKAGTWIISRRGSSNEIMGSDITTVHNWDVGRTKPILKLIPKIIEFLGYIPGLLPTHLLSDDCGI